MNRRRDIIIWAAGFIDGEGHVGLHRSGKLGRHGRGAIARRQPRIVVANIHKAPLQTLQRLFGGNLRLRRPQETNHSACWAWEITGGRGVAACLKQVLPYLQVKDREARILLEFAVAMRTPPKGRQNPPLSLSEIRRRDAIARRLTRLKVAGRG